mmetsp:Transcript_22597/g.72713  ORF Transcript_22597/g.72713 Transcript_22597/m.72713 type:complete len:455 (+) Transcript_22597:126-1490(+)
MAGLLFWWCWGVVVVVHATLSDDDVAAWRKRWTKASASFPGQPRWREKAGRLNVDCTFGFRSGLTSGIAMKGPGLFLENPTFESTPHRPSPPPKSSSSSYKFEETPALCERRTNIDEAVPAQVMVANSLEYLFRQWPSFVNRALFGDAAGMRTFLYVGELPAGLANSVSSTCVASRQGSQLPCAPDCAAKGDRRRVLKSVYFERTDGRRWLNSNHYNKVIASRVVMDHPGVSAVYYLDLDAYYTIDAMAHPLKFRETYDKRVYDLELAGLSNVPFWCVKGARFFARDVQWTRDVLDMWLDLRCGFKDQWSLWHTLLLTAKKHDCLDYRNQLMNYTSVEAMKVAFTHHPAINVDVHDLHRRCPTFKYNSGHNSRAITSNRMPVHRSVPPTAVLDFAYLDLKGNIHTLNVTNLLDGFDTLPDSLAGGADVPRTPKGRLLHLLGLDAISPDTEIINI